MMNWKGCGKKLPESDLGSHYDTCPEVLRRTKPESRTVCLRTGIWNRDLRNKSQESVQTTRAGLLNPRYADVLCEARTHVLKYYVSLYDKK
jgi:hypothetical protein